LSKTKVEQSRRLEQFRQADIAELLDVPEFPLRHPHFDRMRGSHTHACDDSDPRSIAPDVLLNDVRTLITQAERQTTTDANIESTLLYWHIGKRTAGEIPGSERVAYGEQIVDTFSRPLVARYDLGDIERNLWPMIQFVEYLPEEDLVAAG
jgi:DUF1016 N-terminal domain